MSKEELFKKMAEAIHSGDIDSARETATKLMDAQVDPLKCIAIMSESIRRLGDEFERMEVFLPQLILAADAMKGAMEILTPKITSEKLEQSYKGTVIIGTIQGDVHDVGKSIVALMLNAAGFKVIDLGRDVSPDKFVEEAENKGADILGVSILMTAGRGYVKELAEIAIDSGLKEKCDLIAGGGGATEAWVKSVGYEGFGEDAADAVRLCTELMGSRKR